MVNIIIIGAGAAGVAAATRLIENGFTDIKILEAEGRIGGRIYSVKFGNAYVDLGAEFCHGENVIYELVKNHDVLKPTQKIYPQLYHSSDGFIQQNVADELFQMFYDIYMHSKDDNVSVGEYFNARYCVIVRKYFESKPQMINLAIKSFGLFEKWVTSYEGSFSWYHPALASDYQICQGNHLFNWQGRGSVSLLNVLIKRYPETTSKLEFDDKVVLNTTVTKIDWEDNNKVMLECVDGTKYSADHVIVSIPLGVLKHQHETLFSPSLPKLKAVIIEELGMDAITQIFFHFPEKWWPSENFTGFNFLWSKDDVQLMVKEYPKELNENGKHWITDLIGLFHVEQNPNVLEAWFSGECVPIIELLPEDSILNGLILVFTKFLEKDFPNIPRPDSLIRHNWYSHPNFRGGYSYQTVKSREIAADAGTSEGSILSQPLTSATGKETVLFAGEATHPIYYSTLHGAIETGFREADRIINFYNNNFRKN